MNVYAGLSRVGVLVLVMVAVWGGALGAAFALILMDPARTNAVESFLTLGTIGSAIVLVPWGILLGVRAIARRRAARSIVIE